MPPAGSIEIQNVSKRYAGPSDAQETSILDDISLSVHPGDFIGIIGPSGCGKSTLLSMIAGYTPMSSGQIQVGGRSVRRAGPDRVMVFQRPMLFPWLRVADNIAFGLRLKAKREHMGDPQKIESEVGRLLELVNLTHCADRYPHQLSGGMQQRVEIARALAVRPEVLLMDEPFGALDAFTRQEMQVEFVRIHQAARFTTIFVTHDVSEALLMADKVVVMQVNPGRIADVVAVDVDRAQRKNSQRIREMEQHLSDLLSVTKGQSQ
ncbi:MAG TPA: ABC transporter ATP-binding protein [Hyphomicrobiaceae bacterium]